jgi:hypothetical protein
MADGGSEPCWCTRLPPAVPVPAPLPAQNKAGADAAATGCWCPACLDAHIAHAARTREA